MGSMKTNTLVLFIFILINSMNATLLLAGDKTAPKVTAGIVINDSLKKLMDIDGVEPIYSECQSRFAPETKNPEEKIIECLWEGVKSNPKLKKLVQDVYTQELRGAKTTNDGRSPATATTTPLTAITTIVATDYESDPAVVALTDYYGRKLDAILNPEVALTEEERKNNIILTVDHRKFIDLYKSELGKTIVGAFTSYCLDTDPSTCSCSPEQLQICEKDKTDCSYCRKCTISDNDKERAQHREANIKSLKIADLKTDSGDSDKWKRCLVSATNSCKYNSSTIRTQNETTKRSCLVMEFVNSARKSIMVADKQIEFYTELAKEGVIGTATNMKEISDTKISSTDALLEMSSNDVKLALEKPINQKLKDFEGCYKNNVIVNIDVCKKYLNTNSSENIGALAELGMRQIAQEAILEEELGSDQKMREYLKEEGYSPDQIKTMTVDKEAIADLKAQILNRFANQKAAIIKEMAGRIADKTAVAEGVITPKGGAVKKDDISKLEKIKIELESRTSDLQNLVYFNNIVSSYLTVEDKTKKSASRNTASLFSEANTLEKEQAKLLKDQIKDADLKDQKGQASTTDLDVDNINKSFLNYKIKEKKK